MTATAIPGDQATATACVMGLRGEARFEAEAASLKMLAPFTDLEPGEIGEFMLRISPSVIRRHGFPFTLSCVRANRYVPHETLTAGLEMARGWPDAFFATIGKADERYDFIDPARVTRLLEAIEFWLSRKVVEGRGLIIAEAVRAYRAECQSRPD